MIKDMDFASEHLTMNASFSYDGSVFVWDLAMRKDIPGVPAGVLKTEVEEIFDTLSRLEDHRQFEIEYAKKREAENGIQLSAISEG